MSVGLILNLLNVLNKSILCEHIILFNKVNKCSNEPARITCPKKNSCKKNHFHQQAYYKTLLFSAFFDAVFV